MSEAVVAESASLPDSADGVAGDDGVEVVDSAHAAVGEGVDEKDGGVSRPGNAGMTQPLLVTYTNVRLLCKIFNKLDSFSSQETF